VLFVDECHLCWGDTCGYVWGRTDRRIEIPITNQRERQTYFGALNYTTKEFILKEYDTGNGENTKHFMEFLQEKYIGKKIVLIWDGASYHRSDVVKSFLSSVNDGKLSKDWLFTCILFAPNAPKQNPVEDVWLQGKNFLRKIWQLHNSFPLVKFLFKFFLEHRFFDFPKIDKYSPCSDLI